MEMIVGVWLLIPLAQKFVMIGAILCGVIIFAWSKVRDSSNEVSKRDKKVSHNATLKWSKPFLSKTDDHGAMKEVRYCESHNRFQYFEDYAGWCDADHVWGTPMRIVVRDFQGGGETFTFDPYGYFDDPHKPTADEATLFEAEWSYDYKMIAYEVTLLIEGQRLPA